MANQLVIANFRETTNNHFNEISADIDGDRVYFRSPPHFRLIARGEPFLGIALLEAMVGGRDIRIEDTLPISKRLYKTLPEIQTIYACWNSELHKVNVHAHVRPLQETYGKVSAYYSAGVDSLHTLQRHFNEIDNLIMLGPFELKDNSTESWHKAVEMQIRFAQSIGKELITIETNAKQWTDRRRILWSFAQGLVLASMTALLESRRVYIASSYTYRQLFPHGSHTLTDPMWCTEATEIVHDSAGYRRHEKIKELCGNQPFLDNLRVCWHSQHENCGQCVKCIRTMAALHMLEASSKAMPPLQKDLRELKRPWPTNEKNALFIADAIILAQETQNYAIQRIMQRHYLRYEWMQLKQQVRRFIILMDRHLLGNLFRNAYRLIRKPIQSPKIKKKKHRVSPHSHKRWSF